MRRYLLMIILFCPLAAAADAFRWVDENGQVHFGDRPPGQAERLDLPTGDPASAASDEAADEAQTDESATRDDSCSGMRARLERYRAADKLARTNEAGEEVIMSEEEKAGVIERFQKKVDAACADQA